MEPSVFLGPTTLSIGLWQIQTIAVSSLFRPRLIPEVNVTLSLISPRLSVANQDFHNKKMFYA
ncbi:MAG: hypothetical protein AAF664_00425 [Planctomycetota bacterium]